MSSHADTKSKILDVAEELFAEQGLDRVSIRDITDAAKVNIAAVNYHFGGKEELIAAVFERRVGPVNAARIEALKSLQRSKAPKVEQILEAFIRPTVACCKEAGAEKQAFARLFGRCLAEPRPDVEALLQKLFDPLVEQLDSALMKALPYLSRTEIFWRMKFTFGALHHWLLTRDKFLPPWAEKTDLEEQTRKLIAYATAGLKTKDQV